MLGKRRTDRGSEKEPVEVKMSNEEREREKGRQRERDRELENEERTEEWKTESWREGKMRVICASRTRSCASR